MISLAITSSGLHTITSCPESHAREKSSSGLASNLLILTRALCCLLLIPSLSSFLLISATRLLSVSVPTHFEPRDYEPLLIEENLTVRYGPCDVKQNSDYCSLPLDSTLSCAMPFQAIPYIGQNCFISRIMIRLPFSRVVSW